MPLTSTQPARTPARVGVMRVGAFRVGFIPTASNIVLSGTQPLYAYSQVASPAEPNGPPNSQASSGYTITRST